MSGAASVPQRQSLQTGTDEGNESVICQVTANDARK